MSDHAHSSAGDRLNFLWFLDSDGLPIGKTRTRPPAGTSTNGGPLRLQMPKSATPTSPPAPNITLATGEDGSIQHRYIFDADNTQITTVTLSAEDLDMAGVIQNMPVVSLAGGRYTYFGIADVLLPPVMLLLQSRAIRVIDGAQVWQALLYPLCTLKLRGQNGFTERGAATYEYDFAPQPTSYNQFGLSILDNDGNLKQAMIQKWDELAYPLCLQAVTFDGTITDIPVDYQPVDAASSAVILNSQIPGVRGAVAATVSSVTTTAPYKVTVSGAPTPTGRRGVVPYQFKA